MNSKPAFAETAASVRGYATFYVGDLFLGIEVGRVQELLRYQEITPVPLAPAMIQGLINLRGHIVTAVNLREWLHLDNSPAQSQPMNIVLRSRDGNVSLLVDEIGDVLELSAERSEPPPATLRPEVGRIVDRVFKLENKLLLALSAGKLLQSLCDATNLGSESC